MSAADAIKLQPGARVQLFLDTKPLEPVEATLVRSSYEAVRTASGNLAFTLIATPKVLDGEEPPRIGLRGIAQTYGDQVPLYYNLFRRPISALRQLFGI